MLSAERCREVVEQVLARSKADETSVALSGGETRHLRFARNTPSTSGAFTDHTLRVTASTGRRSGSATVNQLDERSITAVVERASEIAKRAPEDPEFLPGLGPQEYARVDAWSEPTAERGSELMAAGVATCIEDAREAGLVAAGFTQSRAGFQCIANSNGLFGYQAATSSYFSETVRTPDGTGSGWASGAGRGVEDLDYAELSKVAVQKSGDSARPTSLEPGNYPAILEPACVASLLGLLTGAMGARSADEGRSYFSAPGGGTRLGERLFPDSIHLRSDPRDPRAPATPWAASGLPQERRDLIRDGRVESLTCGRYWAKKQGVDPVPPPANTLMEGGSGTVADLVRSTERGVLVTSLWYIRSVDPRTLLHTGLTRDGVFWIENGRIARPLHNFRWNDSPVSVLKHVEAASEPVRVPPRARRSNNYVVPALRVSKFGFSSVSEAV